MAGDTQSRHLTKLGTSGRHLEVGEGGEDAPGEPVTPGGRRGCPVSHKGCDGRPPGREPHRGHQFPCLFSGHAVVTAEGSWGQGDHRARR